MEHLEQRFEMATACTDMAIWDSTLVAGKLIDGTVVWRGDGARLLGLQQRDLAQPFAEFLNFVHGDDRARVLETMQQGVDDGDGYELEYRVAWRDGTGRWLAARARIMDNDAGQPARTLGMIWDVTGRVLADIARAERARQAEVTLCAIGDGVITTDADGRISYLNPVAEELTGWLAGSALGQPIDLTLTMIDEASGDPIESAAAHCLSAGQPIGPAARGQLLTKSGRKIAIEDSATPILAEDGSQVGAVAVLRDVSQQRKLARELSWQATHDPLTGLINRSEFERQIAAALRSARQQQHTHALLYMDMDRFKIVNDTCGHGAGDVLLQLLAKMLHRHMREADVLARLGGDELGALLLHCPLSQATRIADEIRQSIRDFRFVWDSRSFELGISIGIAPITPECTSTAELLVAADQACYVAKEHGRNRIHVYVDSDETLAQRHGDMMWLARLNDAFDRDRFRLFSMPIIDLRTPAISHREVLIRMADGGSGVILPGAFIPAAERYDLMASIDRWVIRAVCRHLQQARGGQAQDGADKTVYAINLSGISIGDQELEQYIMDQFAEFAIPPACICFEITETAVICDLPKAQDFMRRMRTLGCRFALDDFGSGVSSFGYLKSLPVDYLKIDGMFIQKIAQDAVNQVMVKAINEVGHAMGIETIAEWVEDEDSLRVVRELGIDYAQGHAIGRDSAGILATAT
jgi:diguanylate cyclase (GGDEF)-like protein/PAS domain S-box-containing protein